MRFRISSEMPAKETQLRFTLSTAIQLSEATSVFQVRSIKKIYSKSFRICLRKVTGLIQVKQYTTRLNAQSSSNSVLMPATELQVSSCSLTGWRMFAE